MRDGSVEVEGATEGPGGLAGCLLFSCEGRLVSSFALCIARLRVLVLPSSKGLVLWCFPSPRRGCFLRCLGLHTACLFHDPLSTFNCPPSFPISATFFSCRFRVELEPRTWRTPLRPWICTVVSSSIGVIGEESTCRCCAISKRQTGRIRQRAGW
ncbi:hypothetical protein P171DRAFT_146850 [Karstenula rhodostoma CBS 690.94]|uniref:Uncharacterized protein n=1 Tax=Karstenula rhodostoma CBS 690.94 TaxID=1392251 RepID=A0A9P4PSZ8_9PLEO|nr:hypothetical protein P171DRAFT_146850 [Karstenula rhodostoma CBS 690.94]